ncbi:MAG: ammonium transporter [Synergistetes bacterium]|nr:MAG: Ammonium transporter [bacterium 42_11]MBC7331355.1 ammonium transporter [Synergistota bacterium]MDK2871376.1 ammonium transporter, Amt family [bacterium]
MRNLYKYLIYVSLATFTCINSSFARDPVGAATLKENPNLPVDYVWILICAFLVMFMQAGFAMLESGFCRAKNVTNIIAKNLIDFCLGSIIFFAFGYALMMGDDWHGLIGTTGWFMFGEYYDVSKYLNMFWMLVFCATSATIVSGAVAERLKFGAYLIYTLVVTGIIYPIYGHWAWGGGWLSKIPLGLGFLDFAGSGVVHALGGFVGLAGALVLGPRYGKYKNGVPQAIPGHSVSLAALGVLILWFGWFGFNPGSTYSAHHLKISIVALNTNLAAAAGGISALLISYFNTGKWDITMALNGVIAGLVAITASCAWVEGWAAILIGFIAGGLMYFSVRLLDSAGIDDPVGAVSVHGICGLWGLLTVGIFADGTYGVYSVEPPYAVGLLYGGGWGQFLAQLVGLVVLFIWAFGAGYVLFKVMDRLFGIRVSPEEELKGLDIYEHGVPAYPDFYSKV